MNKKEAGVTKIQPDGSDKKEIRKGVTIKI